MCMGLMLLEWPGLNWQLSLWALLLQLLLS